MSLISKMSVTREMLIKANGLTNCDSAYAFFYDETNNIGKLYISDEDKLNISELKNFVLGGVLLLKEEEDFKPKLETLKKELKLQKSVQEMKLRHLGQGDFLSIICSPKLTLYFEWLEFNNLCIHYTHIDLFFYSIVDIVDSLLCNHNNLKIRHQNLKADLYELLKPHRDLLIKIFANYHYPNISRENKNFFLNELLGLIEQSQLRINRFNYRMIKDLIKLGLKQPDLPFIEGYASKQLVENFFSFYFSNILMFKNSTHTFDENAHMQRLFQEKAIHEERKICFISSQQEALIQVSDVFAGLMGKFYSYVTYSSSEEIENAFGAMDSTTLKNIILLDKITSKSEKISRALIYHVASLYDLEKTSQIFNRAKQIF